VRFIEDLGDQLFARRGAAGVEVSAKLETVSAVALGLERSL
jgi:hypothetical protein